MPDGDWDLPAPRMSLHRYKSLPSVFPSRGKAKDAHEFVTDTTEERAIPSLVISSSGPDAPVTGSSGTEIAPPLAGWIDTDESKSNTPRPLDGQEESIQQASHIQHTDADQHVLSRLSLVDAPPSEHDVQRYSPKQSTVRGASDDLRTMTLTAPQHDESYDAFGGDGEDLSDVLGRPKSPEELMRNRQSRESVVLGSRGASVRAGAAAPVRRARAVSAAQARVEDRRSRAPSESAVVEGRSQSLKSPEQGTPVARIQTVDLASVRPQQASTPNRSDGARRKEGSGDLASPVTGSRSRHPLGFLGRRRNVSESSTSSGGVHKRSISLNATETSAKTEGQTNSPFWRLGRKNPVVADPALLKVKEADTSSGVPSRPKQKSQQTAKRGSWNSQDEAKACLHGDSWARRKATRGALGPLMQPRQVRVRSRNKHSKEREFGRMYLAQELFLSSNLGSNQAVSPLASPLLKAHVAPMDASQSGSSTDESADAPTSTMTTSATPSSSGKRRATWAMKFSLDGRYLAVAGQDAIIRVYAVLDTPEARNRAILDAKKNVAADPSPLAACAKSNSTTSLHSTATGGDAPAKASNEKQNGNKGGVTDEREMPHLLVFSPKPVKELKGHTSDILDLSWSKGGFLLSASMDKTARIWHLSWANSLVAFVHGDFVTCAVFHPRDDRFFLSGSLDGKLRLWNVSAKKVQASQEVPGLITACAFTHSGNTACVGTFSGAALFYQTDGLNFVSSVAVRSSSGKHQKGGRKITAIEPVLPDTCARVNNPPSIHAVHGGMPTEGGHELHSERVLITSNDSRVRAYDLNTKSVLVRFKAKSYTNRSSQIRATLSDDNDYIIAGSEATSSSEGGQVHIWASASTLFDASNKGLLAKLASGGLSAVTAANQRTTGLLRSGSRKGNNKDGRSSKSDERPAATLEDVVEYFTAHAGTVTCAIMAPVRSNALLRRADDPILVRGESKLRNRLADSAGSMGDNLAGLPIHLGKTISAALSAPLRLTNSGGSASVNQTASPSSGADMAATLNSKLNRIIVTVDDNAVVRVWRSDNLQTLPMMTSGPRARC